MGGSSLQSSLEERSGVVASWRCVLDVVVVVVGWLLRWKIGGVVVCEGQMENGAADAVFDRIAFPQS